jgi:type IV pilus assembly protein PilM
MAKARPRRGLVGVDISNAEIRIVESRISGNKPIITCAGSAPMPANSIDNGEIVRPDAVGLAIRKLIENLGITTTDAVVSVSMAGYTTRSLKLPPAPKEELDILVDGEIRHFGIMRSEDGAYDYFRIATPDATEVSLVVMASESPVTSSLRTVAERSGLNVVALEPAALAMLREAATSSGGFADGLFIMVGEAASEICVVRQQKICLYRRMDVGTNALYAAPPKAPERIQTEPAAQDAPLDDSLQLSQRELRKGPADTFVTEVRRTIEFFTREFPDAPQFESVRMAICDPISEGLQDLLAQGVSVDAQIVRPSGFVAQNDVVSQVLSGETSSRYVAALGLALHVPEYARTVELMDLYVRERSAAAMESKRRTFAGSLVVSIGAIVLGIVGGYYFGVQALEAEQKLTQLKTEAAGLRAQQQQTMAVDRETGDQIAYFTRLGMPAVWLADAVGASLHPGVGVRQINMGEGGIVMIDGEATNEQALLMTVENMQQLPSLGMAYVNSFEKINRVSQDPAIRFQIRLVGVMGIGAKEQSS